jgi:hypothetical protein
MSIKIKQQQQKWLIQLDEETWQFESRKEMEVGLKQLLDLKEKKGNIRNDTK